MIYLFEDKEGRMALYMKAGIDQCLLKRAIMNCKRDEISQYIDDNYSDADAVLFHVSYSFPQSGVTNDVVREAFLSKGIPFVYFSGGSKNSLGTTPQGIPTADIRSEDMYSHLPSFIEEYRATGKINLPLLVFGKNYLMNSLLKATEWVNDQLWGLKGDEPISPAIARTLVSGIRSGMQEEELKEDKNTLLNFINEHFSSGDLTPDRLMTQIQKIIDRH